MRPPFCWTWCMWPQLVLQNNGGRVQLQARFSKAPQCSRLLEGLMVGNSFAAFCPSTTGQLNKFTSLRVFPHVTISQNKLLLIYNHRFSCSVSVILKGRFWLKNIWKLYLTLAAWFSYYLGFLTILAYFCGYFCHYFTLPMPLLKWTIATIRSTLNVSSPLWLMKIIASNSLWVQLIVIAKLHPPN